MVTIEIKITSSNGSHADMTEFLNMLNSKGRNGIDKFTEVMKDSLEKGLILDMVKNTFDVNRQSFTFHLFSDNIDYANAFIDKFNQNEETHDASADDLGLTYSIEAREIPAFLAGGSIKISGLNFTSYIP
jgi:hypothetical protein